MFQTILLSLTLSIYQLQGAGCEEVILSMQSITPLGTPLYHASTVTDRPQSFLAAEVSDLNSINILLRGVKGSSDIVNHPHSSTDYS
jgi:hypothetical protein